ncbi:hypothetical protein M513_11655 [Trichuris suis]|uniref:DUF7041 domain-containing protein n=1 Tax=Trichuris suis TaxID=68888 RepID=A0A085LR98_9BILA|nr:hypothetical protein M513_11655 [Trichuris suis]
MFMLDYRYGVSLSRWLYLCACSKSVALQLVTRYTMTSQDSATVAGVAVKLPPFWPHAPKLWFAQAEAQFHLRGITSSLTQFYYTIAALPDNVAADVDDLLKPYGDSPYEHLKAQLLEPFSLTEDERFRSLLAASSIGDQRPSQMLREMRRLAGTMIDVNGPFFRRLFLHRLPSHTCAAAVAGDPYC